jgi:hypothetical protein
VEPEQVLPLVHWSSEPQGMVQRSGLVPTILQSPPKPSPHEVSLSQRFELNKSSTASHVVAVWLMPQ